MFAKFLANRRGLELSVNFIVVLILTIVTFALGILIYNATFNQAGELTGDIGEQTRAQIEQILMEGNIDVTIPHEFEKTPKDTTVFFGMGIKSNTDVCISGNYLISVAFSRAVDELNADRTQEIFAQMGTWFLEEVQEYAIKNNERRVVSIPIRPAGAVARQGWTYVFDINVQCKGGSRYGSPQKVYVFIQ